MAGKGLTRLAPVLLAALLSACATQGMREHYDKPASTAIAPAAGSPVAKSVQKVAEIRGAVNNESGFRVLTLSTNGLLSRLVLVDKAQSSVDLQYFIFANDDTGKLLAQHLLADADRGVRVRLLVDDINNKATKPMLDALDAHDRIEVRVFNPFNTREPGMLSKAAQMLLEFRRLNRRMHNKSFIVDNKVAVIGGRNIADDYFDAGNEHNYRDLDLLAVGPVVQEASRVFDTYWADDAAVPANAFKGAKNSQADLANLRTELNRHANSFAQSDYAKAAGEELPNGPTADRGGSWFWGPATLVADQPDKIDGGDDQPGLRMAPALGGIIEAAKQDVSIISPYFVPSDAEDQQFLGLLKRGVKLRLVTNSLASTDEPAVQVGYAAHRRLLLGAGAEIFELKPRAGQKQSVTEFGKESAVGLHAKAFVVDSRYVFVGSMNMDNRSKLINTEMGFVVDSPALAKAILDYFNILRQPANAYQVLASGTDKDGDGKGDGSFIHWRTEEGGKEVIYEHEPEASAIRRVEVMMMKLLPIDGLL